MGADFDGARALLRLAGLRVDPAGVPSPRLDTITPAGADDVMGAYRALGGIQAEPVLRPGGWDGQIAGGTLFELDEELHFNRYRLLTLQASSYQQLQVFPLADYGAFSNDHEPECLKNGRGQARWTSGPTEAQYGPSAPRGELDGRGAARWKQRAVYDLMRDLTQLDPAHPRLARISIWDELPGRTGVTVHAAVHQTPTMANATALAELVAQRT